MSTFAQLVDEIISTLGGHSIDMPMAGELVADVTADATELAIDFGDSPGAARPHGLIEVGRELMQVSRFDSTTGLATVPRWGRGVQGSTAVTHDAGDMVTVRPRFPRIRVGQAVNQTIAGLVPVVYVVKSLPPLTIDHEGETVPLPTDAFRVLSVEAEFHGHRRRIATWRTDVADGVCRLTVRECGPTVLHVTYAATPTRLVNDTDEFTDTGLAESCRDLVIYGSLSKLVLSADAAALQTTAIEPAQRAEQVQPSSGTGLARFYQALYTQRLQGEQQRLQQTYPIQLLRRG